MKDTPRSSRRCQWRICVLISEALCPGGDWWSVAQSVVGVGFGGSATVDCVQLREKSLDDRELLVRTKQLVALCRPRGVCVILNDRPDIAVLAGADGVHLGQDDLDIVHARKILGPNALIGVSTHNAAEALDAEDMGADYVGLGAMFHTDTKKVQSLGGPELVSTVRTDIPVFCIGGIHAGNVAELVAAGATRVAIGSAICSAADPRIAAAALARALRG